MLVLWIFLAWLRANGQDSGCTEPEPAPSSLQLLQQNLRLGRGSVNSILADSQSPTSLANLKKLLDGCSGWDCLKQYVDRPDAAYSWRDSHMRLQGSVGGVEWTAALLQMTSQTWLPDLVSPSSWNHSLVVISPKNVSQTGWCFLYVAMGFYGSSGVDKAVEASNPDVQAAAKIAVSVGIPAAVLFNVPAELLTFKTSASQGPLVEDGTLSHSWALFGRQPFGLGAWRPDPRLLLELPMTKAVVRAMDAIGDFADSGAVAGISGKLKFVVMGTSKRGHLCWHAASVDARVEAIVPIAKALNMQGFLNLSQRELGGLPQAATDYAQAGVLEHLEDTPQGRWFINITDAFAYRERFAGLPKLVINAANDEFFVPDHTRVWWPALPDPKWPLGMNLETLALALCCDILVSRHLMIPNSGHIGGGQQVRSLAEPISAFLSGLVHTEDAGSQAKIRSDVSSSLGTSSVVMLQAQDAAELPRLSWSIQKTGAITAKLDKASPSPSEVVFWQATTCDSQRRDFRLHNADRGETCRKCGYQGLYGCVNEAVTWNSSTMQETEHRSFVWEASVSAPADGRWTAFFLTFHWPTGLRLSTEVSVGRELNLTGLSALMGFRQSLTSTMLQIDLLLISSVPVTKGGSDLAAADRRRVLAAATVVGLVDEIDIGLLAASFMQLEKEFGFAPDVLGKLLMARGLANSLSGIVWGSLADRLDRKRIMVASMMLAGIFTMLTPELTTLQGFFATQMSIAFFAAAAVPVTQSLVSEKVEATDRGVAFASLAMCSGFSCSAAALLAGVLSWREAYRIMGGATISLALCLLVAFPAECRPASERTLEGALATEMEQLWAIFRIPTFRALLLGGVVGCIPWNALSFMMMFVEDLGFDSSRAAVLLAVMSVGRILGCLVGGILGDYMARVSPLHGRAFVAQLSIILGMAPLYWVLRCYSHSSRSPSSLASALFTFSLLATWCNPGVDRPLWSELVTPNCRGKIIAWWTAIAQSFGSVFAGPVVGYICVGVLGYQPGAEGSRRANAESLGTAMAICTMLPWIVCFGCYSAIHATYPSDRHHADRISMGLGAKAAPLES
ncbi:aprA [Symbiodinium sp. CCMP2456]|nr:aprA [Symbiodinium sp. CCMP2456]